MVSIGFKKRSYRGGPPPVCIKPPLSGPPKPPGKPAWKIHAYARWFSAHPLRPTDQTRNLTIPWNPIANRYHGPIAFETPMLRVTAQQILTTPHWNLTLLVWDGLLNGYSYTWPAVFVDPEKPFDSHLLRHQFTGYDNLQQLRVML